MPGLVYTFVARGTTVLAEYAAISGNFKTVGIECLQNAQMQEDKFVVTADQYTFNFLIRQGYTYLAVADEAYGRQIPFAFLERVADAFTEKFGEKGRTAAEGGLHASFSPVMQRQLTYCMEHPEEISKMASVQRKVDEVKGVMLQNVEQVLVRGERLDVLVDRTDDLRDQAARFQKQGTQLRKRMWWQNFRVKLIVIGVVVLLVVVIFLLACFTNGRNCVKTGSSNGGSPYAAAPPPVGSSNGAVLPNTPSALVPGPPNLAPATPAGSGSG
eukprot:GHRQ01005403.1.p1 GENE.GHRQ01005403.1~~GHRQ01005403.1.p1  ORF type:complete len:271 (+),score=123.77 GHRQ01005403.1:462-1274(+)